MKFNNFEVKEVKPRIFHFKFKDSWKMAISFFRYQEKFESPNKQVRDGNLTFIQLLELYSKKYGDGDFTYCEDWGGFNVPSHIFENVLENQYKDFHEYDHEMIKAYKYCKSLVDGKFYIIGSESKEYFLHELAHGLFYTNEEYKKEMLNLIKSIDSDKRKKFFKVLKDEQYHKNVFEDEMQAYLATGLLDSMKNIVLKKHILEFKNIFGRYNEI